MELANRDRTTFNLQPGPNWLSFEKFRTEGAKALEPVKNGTVGTLLTRTGQYRILEESDFQKMYGLVSDLDRWRGGLRMVLSAARAVQKHRDSDTVEVVLESIKLLGNLPEVLTGSEVEALIPEGIDLEDMALDEVTLDPNEIKRPLDTEHLA